MAGPTAPITGEVVTTPGLVGHAEKRNQIFDGDPTRALGVILGKRGGGVMVSEWHSEVALG